jgi:drug/metabolite transporter (DMT)-like permease
VGRADRRQSIVYFKIRGPGKTRIETTIERKTDTTLPAARARGYALLFAGMALVGTYVALSKPLTAALPVFLLATLRFGIAAVAMLPWTRAGAGDARLTPPLLRTLFLQSFFGNFLFSICMLYGVSMTSATASGMILSTLPAVVAVFSWLFLGERLARRTWFAVGLAVAGVGILSLARGGPAPASGEAAGIDARMLAGNLLVFGCVCCEAVYVILGKRLTESLSARRISALINLIGLALMLPFGLWQARSFAFGEVAAGTWLLLVFYALAASVWATWLWLTGLRAVPAGHSGVFTIALPLAACTVGVAFLGEAFTVVHGVAFACAAAGIALIASPATRGRRRGNPPDTRWDAGSR